MTDSLPNDYYESSIREFTIYLGLALIIFAGLLIIFGQPVQALEQFNTSLPGERNAGDWFTFTLHNVSGSKDVVHHVTVYSSKLLQGNQTYTYWSVRSGQWFNQTPAKGNRWLFVWVEDWIEGTPVWGYEQDQFSVWIWGNTTVKPEAVQMEDLARERGGHLFPAIIQEADGYRISKGYSFMDDPYGWRDGYSQPRIEPGRSNAWSGWIRYQVPGQATREDLRVAARFMNRDTVYWNLIPREFIQVVPVQTPAPVQQRSIQPVQRSSDRPGAQVIEGRQRG